ncbi:thiamine pyrophosphate-dependent dehydrogenase E1 component subunit alpha, partial [Halobium palmae]
PQAVPVGTQIPHATGAGMARNYAGGDEAMVVCFGDGATSEGDFHEGLNFAGVFDAPVVFFCENNEWAISLPRDRQTASDTIAGKAEAYGLGGAQVDGNDPLAVYEATCEALKCARDGEPVLLEALTYRRGAHTTADDPGRYRDEEPDLPEWRTRDPVERYEEFLRSEGVLDDESAVLVREEADDELAA